MALNMNVAVMGYGNMSSRELPMFQWNLLPPLPWFSALKIEAFVT
jgi:hypothetical protein